MKASFPAKHARTRKVLAKRLKAYLKDSSPENVRSLRIAIRRMSLSIELLPKKMRKEIHVIEMREVGKKNYVVHLLSGGPGLLSHR